MYDPYRITKVLKRAGKRGEGKWKTVPFEQAIEEIVNGGVLFKDVSGEENRKVEGLTNIAVLRDPKIFKELSDGLAQSAEPEPPKKKRPRWNIIRRSMRCSCLTSLTPIIPIWAPRTTRSSLAGEG